MSKVAIVTGAARRVGRHLAEGLRDDGWTVVAHVRDDAGEAPARTIGVAADLNSAEAAKIIMEACPSPPSLLINNAAVFAADSIDEFSPDTFDAHFRVNVGAPAALTAALAATKATGDRLIVNILDAKLAAPNPDFMSYTLSKAALSCLTDLTARALAPRGIRVNGVAPALMLLSEGQSQENFSATHRFNPLGVGVEPDDVLEAIRFFDRSKTITGQVVTLDGGQRFWNLPRDVQFLEPEKP